MAKNRVFGRPMPDASVPRNGFDLSKRITMQLPFGALIPCYAHQYLAGSQVRISMDSFFRTAAVNTAAFPHLKMETEFFCVPLRYLWSYWDNFKLGLKDYNSTALLDTTNTGFPTIASVPSFDVIKTLWPMLLSSTDKDSLGYDWKYGAARLADMLGYGRFRSSFQPAANQTQSMNLFKIAAYQKVYFDHFRNTAYETNDPYSYNLDAQTAPDASNLGDNDLLTKLFTLRYVNYRKDYFRSIFPGLNFIFNSNSVSGVINAANVPSWVRGLATGLNANEDVQSNNGLAGSVLNFTALSSVDRPFFSVQGIRAMYALDKLTRSAAYAPQHVKNQYEARYGIKFPSTSSFESQRIGSFDTDIVIGEVTSTANTEASNGDALGAVGGKGVGVRSSNQTLTFDVKEDSIIIGLCYAMPRTMYDSFRFDNWNMKLGRNDFFIPEFMNMGLKPVYTKEFSYALTQNQSFDTTGLNEPLGYQLPYMEYKADIDENHGLFAERSSDLGQFTVHSNSGQFYSIFNPGVGYNFFKVKPSDMDSIFVNAYDGKETSDQLFGQITLNIACNQNMSVIGVPSL